MDELSYGGANASGFQGLDIVDIVEENQAQLKRSPGSSGCEGKNR